MKLEKLVNSVQSLRNIMALDLPAKTAYRLAKVSHTIDVHLKAFDTARAKVVGKYKGEDGQIPEEHWKVVGDELEAVMDEDVEVSITKLKLSELGDVRLKAQDLYQLDWLVSEDV